MIRYDEIWYDMIRYYMMKYDNIWYDEIRVDLTFFTFLGMERPVSREYLGHQMTHELKVSDPKNEDKWRFFIRTSFSISISSFDAELNSV